VGLAAAVAAHADLPRTQWDRPWDPWVPFSCSEPTGESSARSTADSATDAAPPLRSKAEAVRRVEVELRAVLFGSRWQALVDDYGRSAMDAIGLGRLLDPPAGDPTRSAFAEALRTGAVQARVERVADWRHRRCSDPPERRMVVYVEATWHRPPDDGTQDGPGPLRRFDVLLGADGTLHQWSMGAALSDDAPLGPALASLGDAGEILSRHAGGPLEHLQYVFAAGYPACFSIPCVVGAHGDTLYVLDHLDRVFAFALDPRPRDEVLPPPGHTCLGAPCPGDPWVLEINGRFLAGELLESARGRGPSEPTRSGSTRSGTTGPGSAP